MTRSDRAARVHVSSAALQAMQGLVEQPREHSSVLIGESQIRTHGS